jgi:hypothetical protein
MKYTLFLLSAFLVLVSFSGPKLKRVTVAKKLTVLIPDDFTVMPDEGIATKYPAARKPLGVYTSPNGQVDFSISEKQSTFSEKDLPLLKDIYKASLLNTYSQLQFIRQEIKPINKQNMIVFEFVSTVKDENPNSNKAAMKKYSIAQYYVNKGKVTIFTFNAPAALKDKWDVTANKMMNSIKLL